MKLTKHHGRAFRHSKEAGRACEDIVLCLPGEGRLGVSDGASISFNSRRWAWSLCRQFMSDPYVGADWLNGARTRFGDRFAPLSDDWAASHAWDRGSFATFMGITLTERHLVAHGIGDTVLFVCMGDSLEIWPKLVAEDFSASPALLCSHPGRSAFDDADSAFETARRDIEAPLCGWAGTRLFVATDALAEWVLTAKASDEMLCRLDKATSHASNAGFEAWVTGAIASGEVRRDDCTIVVIDL